MWIWLDKNGKVKQYLTHGVSPVVGETDFQIFAYFDGLNTNYFDNATIKFRKPDRTGSTYPIFFMRKVDMNYKYEEGDSRGAYFNESHGPYTGFLFDFSGFINGENIVRLLDTPGLWQATINVLASGSSKVNVSGLITFNVGHSTSEDEGQSNVTIDQVLENYVLTNSVVTKNSTGYIKVAEDFETEANNGELLADIYSAYSIVFDKKTKQFFKITNITTNPLNGSLVYASYEKAFEYVSTDRTIAGFNLKNNISNEALFEKMNLKDKYGKLIDLQNSNPSHDYSYFVEENNNWYYWNGREWASGGVYYGAAVSIKISELKELLSEKNK